MSTRSQTILIYWTLAFSSLYFAAYCCLIKLLPLPPPTLSAAVVADFYSHNSAQIRIGAALCSWTGGIAVAVICLGRGTVEDSPFPPISRVATDCGFANLSNFGRLYRRRFGCTPREERASARGLGTELTRS